MNRKSVHSRVGGKRTGCYFYAVTAACGPPTPRPPPRPTQKHAAHETRSVLGTPSIVIDTKEAKGHGDRGREVVDFMRAISPAGTSGLGETWRWYPKVRHTCWATRRPCVSAPQDPWLEPGRTLLSLAPQRSSHDTVEGLDVVLTSLADLSACTRLPSAATARLAQGQVSARPGIEYHTHMSSGPPSSPHRPVASSWRTPLVRPPTTADPKKAQLDRIPYQGSSVARRLRPRVSGPPGWAGYIEAAPYPFSYLQLL